MIAEGQAGRALETIRPPNSHTAALNDAVRRERAEARRVRKSDNLDAAEQGAPRDVDERQERGLVSGGMRDLGAGPDREAKAPQQIHGRVVRSGLATIHEIFRGAVQCGVIDVAAHVQLQKPV